MNNAALLERIELLEARVARLEPQHVDDIERIQARVAEYFNLPLRNLRGRSRPMRVVIPRMVAMFLSHETGIRPSTIAQSFNRDPSTVGYAIRTVKNMMETDTRFRAQVEELRMICEVQND